MSSEENKAGARQLVDELFSRGDETAAARFFALDVQTSASGHHEMSLSAIMLALRVYRAAFPDWRVAIGVVVADGDEVMLRWTAQGTHTGVLQGIDAREAIAGRGVGEDSHRTLLLAAPTGRRVTVEGVTHLTFRAGKVASFWALVDEAELMRQVGVLPIAFTAR